MNTKKKYRKRSIRWHNAERLQYLSGLLKEHRLWMGYSRLEIEQEFGISRSVIQRAESSSLVNLTLKTLLEIADVYQVSPEILFQGVE